LKALDARLRGHDGLNMRLIPGNLEKSFSACLQKDLQKIAIDFFYNDRKNAKKSR
jgi:hypothetical protein